MIKKVKRNRKNTEIFDGFPNGIFNAVIRDISYSGDNVYIHLAVLIDEKAVNYSKIYKNVFTNGRYKFQQLCDEFELFVDEDGNELSKLDLNPIIGCECYVISDYISGITSIHAGFDEMLADYEVKEYFGEVEFNINPEIPPFSLMNYRYFPYNPDGFECGFEYLGFITDIELFEDKNTPDEDTLRFHVAVINGGIVKRFDYYINKIYSYGDSDIRILCENFETEYNEFEDLYLIQGKMATVELYTAKSGKTYVSSIGTYTGDKHEKSQHKKFISAYLDYLNSDDSLKFFNE